MQLLSVITTSLARQFSYNIIHSDLDCFWNATAHAQKPELAFGRNGRIHLNRRRRQFSRLLAAEVCASAVVMLDTPCSRGSVKSTGYALHSPISPLLPLPCVSVCYHISTGLYRPILHKTRVLLPCIVRHTQEHLFYVLLTVYLSIILVTDQPLSTCAPDSHLQVWWYQMLYNTIWWWAHSARNM